MYSISSSYLGASCELKTFDNLILTNGKIKKIGYDFIEISNDVGTLSLLKYEENVKVEIRHGTLPSVVVSGRLYLPNMKFFRVVDMDALAESDQREFFRVTTNEVVNICKKNHNNTKGEDIEVNLIDISLGGALISSKTPLEIMDNYYITLKTSIKDISQFEVNIVRTLEKKGDLFNYGLKFVNLRGNQSDNLCRYLFVKQKEIISELRK